MEEFLDAVTGGAIWGVGFGLALSAVRAVGGGVRLRPSAKGAVRGALGLGDWVRSVTAESRETLQDVYHEARAEVEAERTQAGSPAAEAGARA